MKNIMLKVKIDNEEIVATYGAMVDLGWCYSKLAETCERDGNEALAREYRRKSEIIYEEIVELELEEF